MIKLDPRLQSAAELVLPGLPLADIGTDHAYLPIYLVGSGICPSAVAADKASYPIQMAESVVRGYGLQEQISLRCGDGLAVLHPGEVASIVLCGMGGQLMLEILSARPEILAQTKRLVLQPPKNIELVRYWLAEQGWQIVAESMVESKGFYYAVIAAEPGSMCLTPEEAEFGPLLLKEKNPAFCAWLQRQIREREEICRTLSGQEGEAVAQRLRDLHEEIRRMQRLLP